jgi:hypothetical protein
MENETDMYRLERRIGHLERELQVTGSAVVSVAERMGHLSDRSDERLEYIRERFDGIDERLDADNARDRWLLSTLGTLVGVMGTCFYFLWMEPLTERISGLDRRIDYVEEVIIDLRSSPTK